MRTVSIAPVLCILSLSLSLSLSAACGTGGPPGSQPVPFVAPTFDPARFGAGASNPLFPLVPGTIHTYHKVTDEGLEQLVVEVTADTKVILGVSCVVVRATAILEGDLVEDTLDWYAVDDDANVWYCGEDSKDYEGGVVVSTAGSWQAGVGGALPGIVMLGVPIEGATYSQELAPGVAEDMATVLSLAAPVVVPHGSFPACLETDDFTPLDPGVFEQKYYAPGVGLVLEVDAAGDRNELVGVETP